MGAQSLLSGVLSAIVIFGDLGRLVAYGQQFKTPWCGSKTYAAFISRHEYNRFSAKRANSGRARNYPRTFDLKYSTENDGNLIVAMHESQNEELLSIYRTVAEEDPSWYDSFVVNVLGKEAVQQIGLPFPPPREKTVGTAGPGGMSRIKRSSTPYATKEEVARSDNDKNINKPILSAMGLNKNKKAPGSNSKDSPQNSRCITGESLELFEDEISDIEVNSTSGKNKEIESVSGSTMTSFSESQTDAQDEKVVVYQDTDACSLRSAPLDKLASLGYNNEEISRLSSDALSVIISESVHKPRAGVPSLWQIPPKHDGVETNSVQIMTQEEAKNLMNVNTKDNKIKSAFRSTGADTASVPSQTLKTELLRPHAGAWERTDSSDQDYVVFYKDASSDFDIEVPLSNLTSLGYTKDDILLLHGDSIDLILAGQIKKPVSGVPPRWQNLAKKAGQTSSTDVRVLRKERLNEVMLPITSEVDNFLALKAVPTPPNVSAQRVERSALTGQASTSATTEKDIKQNKEANTLISDLQTNEKPGSISAVTDIPLGSFTEEYMVSYTDMNSNALLVVPLSNLTSLGYSKDDITLLHSDVVGLILSDQVKKPRTGIPPQWQSAANENVKVLRRPGHYDCLTKQNETRDIPNSNDQQATRFEQNTSALVEDMVKPASNSQQSVISEQITGRDQADSDAFQESSSMKSVRNGTSTESLNTSKASLSYAKPRPESARVPSSPSTSENDALSVAANVSLEYSDTSGTTDFKGEAEDQLNEVVLYTDSLRNTKQIIPLMNLTSLGYTRDEVLDLQSDFLALIVSDSIPRPQRGVPPKWRISKAPGQFSPDGVKVLPRAEGEAILLEVSTARKTGTPDSKHERKNEKKIRPPRPEGSGYAKENEEQRARKRRKREKSALNQDGTRKNIYNVRGESQKRKKARVEDPPPPKSPFWMDIDTFRKLLRSEAELRLRILGDDFAPAIKDESDWRLGLYRDWLWTLERGVGKPIVPNISDRVRPIPRRVKERNSSSGRNRAKPSRESDAARPMGRRKTRKPSAGSKVRNSPRARGRE